MTSVMSLQQQQRLANHGIVLYCMLYNMLYMTVLLNRLSFIHSCAETIAFVWLKFFNKIGFMWNHKIIVPIILWLVY